LRGSTAFQADEGVNKRGYRGHGRGFHCRRAGGPLVARRRAGVRARDYRILGFQAGVDNGKKSRKRKRAPFESEADEARIDRWQRLKKMDSSKQLKRMMGNEAEFRGVQKEAINAITASESPVVAVIPTGGGKSLLFMLPAFVEQSGTTVIVVPLIALRCDMKRRRQKLGISCVEWESRHPRDAVAVVLVTPKSAVGEAFTTFRTGYNQRGSWIGSSSTSAMSC
jgi:hypothetical protein